jgi:hypothetical protein
VVDAWLCWTSRSEAARAYGGSRLWSCKRNGSQRSCLLDRTSLEMLRSRLLGCSLLRLACEARGRIRYLVAVEHIRSGIAAANDSARCVRKDLVRHFVNLRVTHGRRIVSHHCIAFVCSTKSLGVPHQRPSTYLHLVVELLLPLHKRLERAPDLKPAPGAQDRHGLLQIAVVALQLDAWGRRKHP